VRSSFLNIALQHRIHGVRLPSRNFAPLASPELAEGCVSAFAIGILHQSSSLEARHKPLTTNNLQSQKNNFFKNSPKIACQAPSRPQNRATH
jgi:hypothetical protein